MKAYTTIEQSHKLAKILPLESADMKILSFGIDIKRRVVPIDDIAVLNREDEIPCWSLAALLEEIPSTIVNNVEEDLKLHIDKDNLQYYLFYENEYTGDMFEVETELYENMVDACVSMIEKLHELNLL